MRWSVRTACPSRIACHSKSNRVERKSNVKPLSSMVVGKVGSITHWWGKLSSTPSSNTDCGGVNFAPLLLLAVVLGAVEGNVGGEGELNPQDFSLSALMQPPLVFCISAFLLRNIPSLLKDLSISLLSNVINIELCVACEEATFNKADTAFALALWP